MHPGSLSTSTAIRAHVVKTGSSAFMIVTLSFITATVKTASAAALVRRHHSLRGSLPLCEKVWKSFKPDPTSSWKTDGNLAVSVGFESAFCAIE